MVEIKLFERESSNVTPNEIKNVEAEKQTESTVIWEPERSVEAQ